MLTPHRKSTLAMCGADRCGAHEAKDIEWMDEVLLAPKAESERRPGIRPSISFDVFRDLLNTYGTPVIKY